MGNDPHKWLEPGVNFQMGVVEPWPTETLCPKKNESYNNLYANLNAISQKNLLSIMYIHNLFLKVNNRGTIINLFILSTTKTKTYHFK